MDYSTMYLCMYLKNQILRIISKVMIDKVALVNLLILSLEKKCIVLLPMYKKIYWRIFFTIKNTLNYNFTISHVKRLDMNTN